MLRSVVLSLAALGGLLAFGPAQAFVDLRSEYSANVVLTRTNNIGPGGTVAGRTITSTANFPSPGGGTVAGRVAVSMTTRGIITAAARMLPVIAAGSALYEVMKALRYKKEGEELLHDPGEPQKLLPSFYCSSLGSTSPWMADPTAACESLAARFNAEAQPFTDGGCRHLYVWSLTSPGGFGAGTFVMRRVTQVTSVNGDPCPAQPIGEYIAAYASSMAMRCEHGQPSPVDTFCRTSDDPNQGYTQTKSPDDLGAAWEKEKNNPGMPPFDEGAAADAIRDAYAQTQSSGVPMPAVNQPHVIVEPYPATVPGGVVTTTRDDGWVTETATGWNIRPAFQAPRNPGRSNWEKTTTETTKNANGDIVETKTSTEKPEEGTESKNCEGSPDLVMCAQLGEVEDQELQQKEVNVAITPMDGWGGGGGDCPAPPSFTVLGQAMTFDNTLFCRFFAWMKPLLLAVAWLIAAGTVMGGFRS